MCKKTGFTTWMILLAAGVPALAAPPPADLEQMKKAGVIFYLPFEGSHKPAIASGQAEPFYADQLQYAEGKFGKALHMVPKGKYSSALTYEAVGNFYAEAGTLCFWMKPSYRVGDRNILTGSSQLGPIPFGISSVEQGFYHTLLHIIRRSSHFYFQLTHGDGLETFDYTEAIEKWGANEWHHIAFVWDMEQGFKVYDNGTLRYSSWGRTKLAPLTPWRIAFGGVVKEQVRRNGYDAIYDELLILKRPASDAEIAAIVQGRYDALRPVGTRKPSPFWEKVRRANMHLGEDPHRMSFTPTEAGDRAELLLRADLLEVDDVRWKYKHGFMLADGKLNRDVFLTEGGLAHAREAEFVFKKDADYNCVVIHGRPMPGTRLRRETGDVDVSMRQGVGVVRQRTAFTHGHSARILFAGDSVLNEVMFFRCAAGKSMSERAAAESLLIAGRASADAYPQLRAALLKYPEPEDRRLFEAKKDAAWRDVIGIPPLSFLHVAVPPQKEDRGAARIRVDLLLRLPGRENVIRATVANPFDISRVYFDLDFAVDTSALNPDLPVRLTLDLSAPGMILPNDRPLFLSLSFDSGATVVCGDAAFPSLVAIETCPVPEVVDAFSKREVWALNDIFTSRMGLNRFDNPGEPKERNPLRIALARIFRYDPDNAAARNLYCWARFGPWPKFEPSQGDPRWAVLARDLLKVVTRQIHWWIDNRQEDTGYVVGEADMWNDVTKLYTKYQFLPLISGDRKLVESLDRYLDAHWDMSGRITGGYSTYQLDILHTAEEATYNTPAMALLEYGRPKHVERLMETADFMRRKIIRKNKFGRTGFRSNYFSGGNVWLDGVHANEYPICQSVTTPLTALVWYNRDPVTRKLMLDWGDSILDMAKSPVDGKKAGYLPSKVNFLTNAMDKRQNTYKRYYYSHLLACYAWTGDRKYLEPIRFLLAHPEPGPRDRCFYQNMLGYLIWRQHTGDASFDNLFIGKAALALDAIAKDSFFQRGLAYHEVPCLLAWVATRDKKYLEQTMIHDIRNNHRAMLAYTEMDPDTDRVYPWGRWVLPQMYLGGQVLSERASLPYPANMITWENTGIDFAALVLDSSPRHLRLLLYGFEDADRPVVIRNWGLGPGTYRVTEGIDRDGDDKPDEMEREQRVVLRRMSQVRVVLPSRKTHVIEFTQVQAGPDSGLLPDLAIGPEDVEVTLGCPGEGLIGLGPYPPRTTLPGHSIPFIRIRVHNIGSARAGRFTVQVKDGLGKLINQREVADGLDAPLDLHPKVEWVTLRLREHMKNIGPIEVIVDSKNEVEEIWEENNSLRIRLPALKLGGPTLGRQRRNEQGIRAPGVAPRSAPVFAEPTPPWERKLRAALKKRMSCSFEDTPLRDVVAFLRQMTQTNFVLDQAAIAKGEPLVTMTLKDVTVESVLNLALGQEFEWVIRDEVIFISTRD